MPSCLRLRQPLDEPTILAESMNNTITMNGNAMKATGGKQHSRVETLRSGTAAKTASSRTTIAPMPRQRRSQITHQDVIFGKGHNKHEGNQEFRALVQSLKKDFAKAKTFQDEKTIVKQVVAIIQEKGGRFMRLQHSQWIEVENKDAWKKTTQAFIDATKTRPFASASTKPKRLQKQKPFTGANTYKPLTSAESKPTHLQTQTSCDEMSAAQPSVSPGTKPTGVRKGNCTSKAKTACSSTESTDDIQVHARYQFHVEDLHYRAPDVMATPDELAVLDDVPSFDCFFAAEIDRRGQVPFENSARQVSVSRESYPGATFPKLVRSTAANPSQAVAPKRETLRGVNENFPTKVPAYLGKIFRLVSPCTKSLQRKSSLSPAMLSPKNGVDQQAGSQRRDTSAVAIAAAPNNSSSQFHYAYLNHKQQNLESPSQATVYKAKDSPQSISKRRDASAEQKGSLRMHNLDRPSPGCGTESAAHHLQQTEPIENIPYSQSAAVALKEGTLIHTKRNDTDSQKMLHGSKTSREEALHDPSKGAALRGAALHGASTENPELVYNGNSEGARQAPTEIPRQHLPIPFEETQSAEIAIDGVLNDIWRLCKLDPAVERDGCQKKLSVDTTDMHDQEADILPSPTDTVDGVLDDVWRLCNLETAFQDPLDGERSRKSFVSVQQTPSVDNNGNILPLYGVTENTLLDDIWLSYQPEPMEQDSSEHESTTGLLGSADEFEPSLVDSFGLKEWPGDSISPEDSFFSS